MAMGRYRAHVAGYEQDGNQWTLTFIVYYYPSSATTEFTKHREVTATMSLDSANQIWVDDIFTKNDEAFALGLIRDLNGNSGVLNPIIFDYCSVSGTFESINVYQIQFDLNVLQ